MIIISGCPRSGTSLMMDIMRLAFGCDRIIGSKFPIDEQQINREVKLPKHLKAAIRYIKKNTDQTEQKKEIQKAAREMNPKGFWECKYTVNGIMYDLSNADHLETIRNESKDALSICKIVSQGLYKSDPRYIDKIIYMIREPRAVAKSQENLKHNLSVRVNGKNINALEGVKVHSPQMFITVNACAAKWLLVNKDVSIIVINFDDLIEQPKQQLDKLQLFLNEGDFSKAIKTIDPKLRRSYPLDVENNIWEDAEAVYKMVLKYDWEKIVRYTNNIERNFIMQQREWNCTRAGRMTNSNICKSCYNIPAATKNFRITAEANGVKWQSEPCLYECAFDPTRKKFVTINKSIQKNFWLKTVEIENPGE